MALQCTVHIFARILTKPNYSRTDPPLNFLHLTNSTALRQFMTPIQETSGAATQETTGAAVTGAKCAGKNCAITEDIRMLKPTLLSHRLQSFGLAAMAASTLLAAPTASADRLLGIFVGASSWQQEFDGFIEDRDATLPAEIDFQDDLGLDDDNGNVLYVALEHPVPFLPNVMLKQTNIEVSGNGQVTQSLSIGNGTVIDINDPVSSAADLSHDDLTLYYQILDNYVSLDLGITARFFDGYVEVNETSATNDAREEFDAVIPLVYLNARVDLPFTGAYAGASGNVLGDGDNMFADYQGVVGWESDFGLGVELGYRVLDLELDDLDDIDAELTVDGGYAGLFFHF